MAIAATATATASQLDLFNPNAARFNGSDYKPDSDNIRLSNQAKDIYFLMRDARWRTLEEIAEATGHPESSVSAQLRHLRKERFGSHVVNKYYMGNGLYQYQLIVSQVKIHQDGAT